MRGEITRIDQGSRTRGLPIGSETETSEVNADAAIFYVEPNRRPQLLQACSGTSNNGRKPCMASQQAGMAPAAPGIAGGAHGETKPAEAAAEGQRVAEDLSRNIGQYFAQQGWIPALAAPAASMR